MSISVSFTAPEPDTGVEVGLTTNDGLDNRQILIDITKDGEIYCFRLSDRKVVIADVAFLLSNGYLQKTKLYREQNP